MADDPNKPAGGSTEPQPPAGNQMPPGRPMPKLMQYALGVYVIGTFFFLLYLLVKTWPLNLKTMESSDFFWGVVQLPPEIRLMFVAAIAGGLGSYVHLATSFADYAGNEKLTTNWAWWYVLRPFIGMALAEVVYIALRGGLISGTQNAGATTDAAAAISPFGVAATAALTGLFSKQATDKLREVFETLFRTQEKVERKDALPVAPTPPADQTAAAAAGKTK